MKILIIHASAGAGHTKAAEALFNGLKGSSRADREVTLVDALDYTLPLFKKIYQRSYSFMVTRCPWLWGFFFGLADRKILRYPVKIIRRLLNGLNTSRLVRFLKEENFDYVISTHFLSNEVISYLKRKRAISSKIICVITDFDVHSIWIQDSIDCYAVACELTQKRLLQLGVPESKGVVTGIPIDEKFLIKRDKRVLRRELGLKEDVFTTLVVTGSFGMGPMEDIACALRDFQVIVVCGRNKKLFERLQRKKSGFLHVYGLVPNMDELMACSDVMITKPGGLSITEALVSGLPLIFFNAIPGQETGNIQILKEYGIGLKCCTIDGMVEALRQWGASPDVFKTLQQSTQRLAKPHAFDDIIALIS